MLYTFPVSYTLTNAGGTTDLISAAPADDQVYKLVKLVLGNRSEIAEAQEEDLQLDIYRLPATVTAGSGGSAFTTANAGKVKRMSTALSTGAIRYNDTTPATTSGTAELLESHGWNLRATPLILEWPEDQRYDVKQGELIVVTLPVAVADDMTLAVLMVLDIEGVV